MHRTVHCCSLMMTPKAGELLQRFCVGSPYRCETFRDPKEALSHFERHGADVVVTDLRMPGMDGLELLARIRTLDTEVPVIIVTAYSRLEHAIEALRHGASDFLKKPFDMEELMLVVDKTLERSRLHRENRLLRRELQSERRQLGLVGASAALRHTYNLLERVADVRCNVIIRGESGTGKELAARAIHTLGPAPGHAVHRRRLRGIERHSAGVGVVRSRKGRLYRCVRDEAWSVRGGSRWHGVSR